MKNVFKKAAIGNMPVASFFFLFRFLLSLQDVGMFSFKPCMLSTGVWRNLTFLWLVFMLRCYWGQGLVADVPLCSCNTEVLMWKSADFFWEAFNKDSWYVFNMLSRLSLLFWWSPASLWVKMKFCFSAWVYNGLYLGQLSMASQQKFLWHGFFSVWNLSLLYLLYTVSPSYFLVHFKMNFYPGIFCRKQN